MIEADGACEGLGPPTWGSTSACQTCTDAVEGVQADVWACWWHLELIQEASQ
jgi:hypothetical protein